MHAEKMMADILPKAYEWAFELFVAAEPYTVDRPEWCGLFYRAFVICVKRFSQNQVCLSPGHLSYLLLHRWAPRRTACSEEA